MAEWIMTNLDNIACFVVVLFPLITFSLFVMICCDYYLYRFNFYRRWAYGDYKRNNQDFVDVAAKAAIVLGLVNILVPSIVILGYSYIKDISILDMLKSVPWV